MSASVSAGVVSFEQARHIVEQHASTLGGSRTESVDLLHAGGRVLAESIYADRDFPPFRRAARDGYAVRAADVQQVPAALKIVGEIRAGAPAAELPTRVGPGEAVGIMTGAPTPDGADSIVMVEYTSQQGDQVQITRSVQAGENIVPTGSEGKQGELLLSPGLGLAEAAIAAIASVGKTDVQVYAKPRIAVIATGDEIVPVEATPGPNQIRNSNTYSLATQIQAAGAEPAVLPIAPDEPKRLRELIEEGLQADLVLLAGGVSMGKYDLVEQVLSELQAEFFFTGAQIQPGKPIVFGRVPAVWGQPPAPTRPGRKYFFGLPGNPVSTMVTFELFARPIIEALSGMNPRKLVFVYARLKADIKTRMGLKRFLPGTVSGEFENAEVALVRWGGSGDIAATARANCYVVVPPDRDHIAAGELMPVLLR